MVSHLETGSDPPIGSDRELRRDRTIGFHRSKRQSSSMHREQCIGIKILEFRQTPRGREFSYLCYF